MFSFTNKRLGGTKVSNLTHPSNITWKFLHKLLVLFLTLKHAKHLDPKCNNHQVKLSKMIVQQHIKTSKRKMSYLSSSVLQFLK